MFQIFYMLNCRSLKHSILHIGVFSNPMVFVGIGVLLSLQMMFVYAPFMREVFGTSPLGMTDLGLTVLAGTIILPIMSIEKFVRKRQEPG
jgi:Ca2+-transporting ATPase